MQSRETLPAQLCVPPATSSETCSWQSCKNIFTDKAWYLLLQKIYHLKVSLLASWRFIFIFSPLARSKQSNTKIFKMDFPSTPNIDSCNLLCSRLSIIECFRSIFSCVARSNFLALLPSTKACIKDVVNWRIYCGDYCCRWWCGWKKRFIVE